MKMKTKMNEKVVPIVALLVLLVSILFYQTATGNNTLPDMQRMAGQGSVVEKISGQLYQASVDGIVIGYLDRQDAIGYAGPIDLIVLIDKDGKLKDITVVNHTETPSFFSKVMGDGFLKQFKDKEANSPFELGKDIDKVTRATYTSLGITEAVRKASYHIATTQLDMVVPETDGSKLPLEDYLMLALLLAVLVFSKLKWHKMRNLTFLAGFLLIGYWQKSLLTLGNFSSLLSWNIPWQNLSFWLILLVGTLLLILFTGRNLYCYWICPYGALSELLGAFGKFGRMNYKPCQRSVNRFKNLRLCLAWAALVFAFFMKNPSISSYEIFAPLFAREGSTIQWLLLPIMLFTSVFIFRFWCRFFCPVGGILDQLVKWRRSGKEWIKAKMLKSKSQQIQASQTQQNLTQTDSVQAPMQ